MRILGELAASGVIPSVAWALQRIVRDVLEYRWKRELLQRTPESQMPKLVRALDAKRDKHG